MAPKGTYRVVTAEQVRDGKILEVLGNHFCKIIKKHALEKNINGLPDRLDIGSACSGSGGDKFTTKAVAKALTKAFGRKINARSIFVCEIKEEKQKWLDAVYDDEPDVCCFTDIMNLDKVDSDCSRHKNKCRVLDVFGYLCGFSCTAVSKMNKNASSFSMSKENATSSTFNGARHYVRTHKPFVFVFENVDALNEGGESKDQEKHSVQVQNVLIEEGYEVQIFTINSMWFGLPQRRQRIFIVGLLKRGRHIKNMTKLDFDNVFIKMADLLDEVRSSAPDMHTACLKDDDDRVKQIFEQKITEDDEDVMKSLTTKDFAKQHRAFCKANNIRYASLACSEDTKQSPWFKFLSCRESEVLAATQRLHGEHACCYVDQSIDRSPMAKCFGDRGPLLCPTLCGHTKMWLARKGTKKIPARQRLLTGREALSFQGFPHHNVEKIDQFSDSFLRNLAGNAYPLPIIMAILLAVLSTVPWAFREADEPRVPLSGDSGDDDEPDDDDSDEADSVTSFATASKRAMSSLRECMQPPSKRARG